jgi:hypothetical protein
MRRGLVWAIIATVTSVMALETVAQVAAQDRSFKSSQSVWKLRDVCSRNANKQFPDHTSEGNAKRERAFQQCLAAYNLPYEPALPKENNSSRPR